MLPQYRSRNFRKLYIKKKKNKSKPQTSVTLARELCPRVEGLDDHPVKKPNESNSKNVNWDASIDRNLGFPKNLGTKLIVRASSRILSPAAFGAAGGASWKKRELSCVHASSYSSY